MDRLLYVGYYDTEANAHEKRNHVLSATNKMTYICSAANQVGWDVEIVSASGTQNRAFCKGKRLPVHDGTTLKLFASIGNGNKIKRVLHRASIRMQMFFYLLKHTKKGQPVLVYHSLGYMNLVRLLKKLKRFQLILEVEEIYSDVSGSSKGRQKELNFFTLADRFLFPTELLDAAVNTTCKPSAIVYGTYRAEAVQNTPTDDGNIHLLYAGTLDPRKGGAQAAILSVRHLPEQYHMHILGFGSEKDLLETKELILQTDKQSVASVTYDGLRSGADYTHFVQGCHAGLSTQTSDGIYNETSFPSKVLSYLSNGLRVMSVRLKVLERAKIGQLLHYCEENTPEAIAAAIQNIDFSVPYDSRAILSSLDEAFRQDLKKLLEE